ncbi:PRTRC system ThiF family protein [Dyadobacter luteus]|uniref:PRTRC system ThiF family protein n=1 Tax=Dyadobacter luteus TaxID=2259619 RepID=A0A3D8YGB4_9BACT|nr:PRTRC system ThiF family protein [Dyadobacter luteus]REA63429.1 PRTRC system ThiF family protein [Dyadobacter luteus]
MNIALNKPTVHFAPSYLLNPANPVTVNLIGAGGTGSRVLTALAEISHALTELGHAGLFVRMFDDDLVCEPNLGRQRFSSCELGLNKAVVRINNVNRFFGTNWKAFPYRFDHDNLYRFQNQASANIFISCVDTVAARLEIARMLKTRFADQHQRREKPYYWIDYGNSSSTGQVILSTISSIPQPDSEKFHTVSELAFVTDEFAGLLESSESDDNTPSCSLAEALEKQDLFINAALTQLGSALLWSLFRQGMTKNRGVFLNLDTMISQPLKVA